MRRLTENLRRDGALSSAPLIYGDRIISGHHRVEAAIKAGIVEADCLSIEGDVDEGRLTAIQLSHNSLAGEDDPEVLRQMLEGLMPLEQAYAAVLDMEVPKPPPLRPSIGTPDTVTVAVTFTPPDVEEIRRVADLSLFAQIEPLDQMRDFLEAVFAVKLQTTFETGWASRGCSRRWPGCRSGRWRTGILILSVGRIPANRRATSPKSQGQHLARAPTKSRCYGG